MPLELTREILLDIAYSSFKRAFDYWTPPDQHLLYFSRSTLLSIPLNRHSLGSFNFFFIRVHIRKKAHLITNKECPRNIGWPFHISSHSEGKWGWSLGHALNRYQITGWLWFVFKMSTMDWPDNNTHTVFSQRFKYCAPKHCKSNLQSWWNLDLESSKTKLLIGFSLPKYECLAGNCLTQTNQNGVLLLHYTLKTGITFGNRSSIQNLLRWAFHSQIKMFNEDVNPIPT